MTIAGYDFFSCFILLEFVLHVLRNYFSLTASFLACSLWPAVSWLFSWIANSMKKPSSSCLSPLAHRIINAWHNSGPDLQSAPTPWMLDASAPIGGSQLLLACFACLGLGARLVLVSVWLWSLSPDALVIYVCVSLASCSRGSSAPWSMCDTVVILLFVQDYHSSYCAVLFSLPPFVAQTLLIFSTQTDFNPNVVCPEQGGSTSFSFFSFLLWHSTSTTMLSCLSHSVSLFQSYSHRFQLLRAAGRILGSQQ